MHSLLNLMQRSPLKYDWLTELRFTSLLTQNWNMVGQRQLNIWQDSATGYGNQVTSHRIGDMESLFHYQRRNYLSNYSNWRGITLTSEPEKVLSIGQTGECVYKITCHNWSSTYIGETGRSYGKTQEEHRKEKKWNPSATKHWHGQIGKIWQQKPTCQP